MLCTSSVAVDGGRAPGSGEVDEYDDDDDPGYVRMDVVGQEAALGRESGQAPGDLGTWDRWGSL
jgi:hypothetical protein